MDVDNMSSTLEGPPAEPASRASTRGRPFRRILVVDDDESIRHVSTKALTAHGFSVDGAEDGDIAWKALQDNSYDMVITDHNMPVLTGLELIKKLRAARMSLPVILVSGILPSDELNRHPNLHLTAVLMKPFTLDELVLAVHEGLSGAGEPRPANFAPTIMGPSCVPIPQQNSGRETG
jgi:DNA-binding response OmpR family regulator